MLKFKIRGVKMFVSRVEKHIINSNHELYNLIDDYSFKSKNLYNYANFLIRQTFVITYNLKKEKEISQEQQDFLKMINAKVDDFNNKKQETLKKKKANGKGLNKIFKPLEYFDAQRNYLGYDFLEFLCSSEDPYKQMMSQVSQQTLKVLDKNWKSFFEAVRDWGKAKNKYTGLPKPPKYKHKTKGRFNIYFTNQNCKLVDGFVKFPICFNQFLLKTKVKDALQQVRIKPYGEHYVIEVVYKKEIQEPKEDNNKYLSIDIGLDNLATIVSNTGIQPVIINGKGLKSINKYYNKQKSHYQEVAKRMNDRYSTNRLGKITHKRNNMIDDLMHKASKKVIDIALENNISVIIIGNNKDWKRESSMSKKVNQSFAGIPHQRFIKMVQYKAENVGIRVQLIEESYTSGTSFLDGEMPIKNNYNKSRRVHRGLFVSNKNIKINADVNGAYQIMKKVFPNAYADGIEGVVLHPIRVNI